MNRICVFCGSSMGYQRIYRDAAADLGRLLAESHISLVYGGAGVGLMKVLADTTMQYGGEVVGIMPQHLVDKEVAHPGIHKLHVVDSMAERKSMMISLSDGFIALPGGFGTLDELSEVLTFNQLRLIDKPLGILNINKYFDSLLKFFDQGVSEGFVREEHRNSLIVSFEARSLINKMKMWQPVAMGKWIDELKAESQSSK
ncbi:MAG: TIGR00730 family Rossman fold protein [Bacteroidales bacterium]|nr:TIGR00730 family Rossman fold protein [Bacteroidales bacterium]